MMMAGLNMMSLFLIFLKKVNDSKWMRLSKIRGNSGKKTDFPQKLLGSTLKSTKLLERTGGRG